MSTRAWLAAATAVVTVTAGCGTTSWRTGREPFPGESREVIAIYQAAIDDYEAEFKDLNCATRLTRLRTDIATEYSTDEALEKAIVDCRRQSALQTALGSLKALIPKGTVEHMEEAVEARRNRELPSANEWLLGRMELPGWPEHWTTEAADALVARLAEVVAAGTEGRLPGDAAYDEMTPEEIRAGEERHTREFDRARSSEREWRRNWEAGEGRRTP